MAPQGLAGLRRLVRTDELNARGLNSRAIAEAVRDGHLERIARGLYIPTGTGHEHEDLAKACAAMPGGVVCLETALRLHRLTMPRADGSICVAIPWDTNPTTRSPVPMLITRWRDKAMRIGVAEFQALGVKVRYTDPARTVVDMFRHRGPGNDRTIEALRDYLAEYGRVDLLMDYARELGAARDIRPQVQALMSLNEFRAPRQLREFKPGRPVTPAKRVGAAVSQPQDGGHRDTASQSAADEMFDDGLDDAFNM